MIEVTNTLEGGVESQRAKRGSSETAKRSKELGLTTAEYRDLCAHFKYSLEPVIIRGKVYEKSYFPEPESRGPKPEYVEINGEKFLKSEYRSQVKEMQMAAAEKLLGINVVGEGFSLALTRYPDGKWPKF